MRLHTHSRERAECALRSHLAAPAAEYMRPWKLVTLAAGIGLLIAGSVLTPAPDWGTADSIVLAVASYLTAPLVVRWVVDMRWRMWPVGLYLTWFVPIGLYQAWWLLHDPSALALMGDAAHVPNVCMFIACGLLWAPRSSLRDIIARAPVFMRGAARLRRRQI